MDQGVAGAVRSAAARAAESEGVELVDLEFRREPVGWVLRLFIDKPGGVSLADCQRVSEVAGTLLEVEDPIPHAYTLEVSSPGLTRPLAGDDDWRRAVGTLVKIVTHQPIGGRQTFVGRLQQATAGSVVLDLDGNVVEIDRAHIAKARREVEWPAPGAGGDKGRRGRKVSDGVASRRGSSNDGK